MLGRVAGTSGAPRSRGSQSAFLRVALVGPTHASAGRMAPHTVALAQQLSQAGHEVTLVSWSPEPTEAAAVLESTFPRTVRSLARNRPDTWVRTGRRLRGYDAVVIVHTGAAMVPFHLALLQGAGIHRHEPGAADGGPRGVVLCDALLPPRPGAASRSLVATFLGRVNGVLVHRREEAPLATRLGAARVYAVEQPAAATDRPGEARIPALATTDVTGAAGSAGDQLAAAFAALPVDPLPPDLTAPWAAYVGAIEALAASQVAAADLGEGEDSPEAQQHRGLAGLAGRAVTRAVPAVAATRRLAREFSPRVELTRTDLPEWVRPTDVLDDGWQADEARDEARRLGLPRVRDGIAAWAALGALAAVVRVADDGHHAALVVDESGPQSPLTRWARACGFAPVDLGLTVVGGGYDALDVDAGSLDVVARVHPGGCDTTDVDETLSQAGWALRAGGLLVITLPLGRSGTDLALGSADVRALVARAHEHGFVLVGDLDGDIGRRMRAAGVAADGTATRIPGSAYGLVRLTLRRR